MFACAQRNAGSFDPFFQWAILRVANLQRLLSSHVLPRNNWAEHDLLFAEFFLFFFHFSVCIAWGCFFSLMLFFQYTLSGQFSTLIRCYFHWENTNQPKKLQGFQDRQCLSTNVNKWASASRMVYKTV